MDCLLFGGAQSVGKSETIYRLANRLLGSGFVVTAGNIPPTFSDFLAVVEGKNGKGKDIRIILNSATDTIPIIKNFKIFFDKSGGYDILISSVRDHNFWPRQEFFNIMNLNSSNNFILEVPLGKITRKNLNFGIGVTWFSTQLDILVRHILNNNPFNL